MNRQFTGAKCASYQNILFDFDGTLADSAAGIMNAADFALKQMGELEQTYENLLRFIGPPLRHSFSAFYGYDENRQYAAVDAYRMYYDKYAVSETALYSGVIPLLSSLKMRGCFIGIASTKNERALKKMTNALNINVYLNAVIGSSLDGTLSGKGELIRLLLQEIPDGNMLESSVYIGDSRTDAIGAEQAGIDFIASCHDRDLLEFDGLNVRIAKSVEDFSVLLGVGTDRLY